MSIKIMTQVWDSGPENQSDCFVMLALADYANSEGECWPSIESIAQKTRLTDRGVRKIIRRLEADGWLEISTGNGRKGCNRYALKTQAKATVEGGAQLVKMDRLWVLKRDEFTCQYCGFEDVSIGHEAGADLDVDHIFPQSRGGANDASNLAASCKSCNQKKKSKTPSQWLAFMEQHQDVYSGFGIPFIKTLNMVQLNEVPLNVVPQNPEHGSENPEHGSAEPSITISEPSEDTPLVPTKKKRACELPEGWVPSERNYQDAYDRGFSQEEINNEADKFSNHHHAKGSTFKSWDAAWRTWLGNAITYRNRDMARGTQPGGRGQGGSIASIAARRRAARAL